MQADTVTLILSGDVPLETFAAAIQRFSALVTGLSIDTGAPDLDWVLADLQVSSAVATVQGRGEPAKVLAVVRAYERVGAALERHEPIPYSAKVHEAAKALRAIVGGRVESVTFETSEREAIIRAEQPDSKKQGAVAQPAPPLERSGRPPSRSPAYGAVEGQVQTLSNRGGLRFTLYDLLYDKAVSCYLAEGHEEIMRGLWGKRAVVEGLVTRGPVSGRPLAVRQVAKAQEIPEGGQLSYRDARGAAPTLSGLSAKLAIRRLRDDA